MSKGDRVAKLLRSTLTAVAAGAASVLVATVPVGASLDASASVAGTQSLSAIACPMGSRCIAVGSDASANGKSVVVNTANGDGTAWSGVLASNDLFGVACAMPTDCVAASTDQLARVNTANGALTPAGKVPLPSGGNVSMFRIACPNATECFAVGFIGAYLHTKGLVVRTNAIGAVLGTQEEATKSGFGAIACPTATLCLLAAADYQHPEAIQLLSNGHFGTEHVLPSNLYVQQLACYKNVVCYGLLGAVSKGTERTNLLYAIDPATGAVTAKRSLGATFSADGIACGTATQCVITGNVGTAPSNIIVSNGAPGVAHRIPGTGVSDVACTDTALCFAVGQNSSGGLVERV